MNLIDTIKGFFTPEANAGICETLSESPQKVNAALSAAIPAALASIGGMASKPDGARTLFNAVQNTDDSILTRGADLFRGGSTGLLSSGAGLLSSLFGGGVGDGVVSAISKFSGIGQGSAKNLLGMVLPIVMGFVGKSAAATGVRDANGLTSFFKGQAGSIASAIPSGLQQHLSAVPGISGFTDMAKNAASQVSSTVGAYANSGVQQARTMASAAGSGASRFVPVLLILAALGAIAWYLWPKADNMVYKQPVARQTVGGMVDTAKTAAVDLSDTAQKAAAELGDKASGWLGDVSALGSPALGKELTGTFGDLSSALTNTTDLDDSKAKLADLSTRIDGWKQTIATLAPEKQAMLRDMLRKALPTVENAANKAMSIPGAQEKIGPTANKIIQTLKSYSQPPAM